MKALILVLAIMSQVELAQANETVNDPAQVTTKILATPTSSVNQTTNATQSSEARKFSANLLIDTSSTLLPGASGSAGEGLSQSGFYRLDLSGPLPGLLAVSLRGGYSQQYSYVNDDGSSGGFSDTRLGLSRAWGEITKDLKLSTALYLSLPTSKASRLAGMKSGLGFGLPLELKSGRFVFDLEPRYWDYFYELTVQNNGVPNTSRSITAVMQVAYNFTEKFSADILYQPIHGWTYGDVPTDSYYTAYELGYEFNKYASISAGLLTAQNVLRDNGVEKTSAIFDQGVTTGYLDLVFSL
jgi:hypothetical protein